MSKLTNLFELNNPKKIFFLSTMALLPIVFLLDERVLVNS